MRRQNKIGIYIFTFMIKNPFKNRWKAEIERFLMVKKRPKTDKYYNFYEENKINTDQHIKKKQC